MRIVRILINLPGLNIKVEFPRAGNWDTWILCGYEGCGKSTTLLLAFLTLSAVAEHGERDWGRGNAKHTLLRFFDQRYSGLQPCLPVVVDTNWGRIRTEKTRNNVMFSKDFTDPFPNPIFVGDTPTHRENIAWGPSERLDRVPSPCAPGSLHRHLHGSAGERQWQILEAVHKEATETGRLVLFDSPEAGLHPDRQKGATDPFSAMGSQCLFASHSYDVATTVPPSHVVELPFRTGVIERSHQQAPKT